MSIGYRLIVPGELDATLLGAWRTIQSMSNVFASPYFCPEFTQLVAEVRDDVRIVVIEDNGRPVGFFPFQRSLFGMGKPVGGPLSDCHGVVVNPACDWQLGALMRAAKLSVWTFDHLVGDVGRFEGHVTARATSPQIDLSAGYERYAQGRREAGSQYIRKTEGLARKLGSEVGELQFTLHEAGSEVMEMLFRWKSDQYRRSRLINVFGVRWTGELLRRIAHKQTTDFAGVYSVLRAGDRVISVHFGMRSHSVLHYWFPAYDPEFAKFSTGIILLLRIARALGGMGVQTIDLGKGDAQYKQRLMTGAIELQEGEVEIQSLLAGARRFRRVTESLAAKGGMAAALRLPLKVIRRIEWARRFH